MLLEPNFHVLMLPMANSNIRNMERPRKKHRRNLKHFKITHLLEKMVFEVQNCFKTEENGLSIPLHSFHKRKMAGTKVSKVIVSNQSIFEDVLSFALKGNVIWVRFQMIPEEYFSIIQRTTIDDQV